MQPAVCSRCCLRLLAVTALLPAPNSNQWTRTDVRHVGALKRLRITQALLELAVPCGDTHPSRLFDQLVLRFMLWLLARQARAASEAIGACDSGSAARLHLNAGIQMLRCVAREAAALADDSYDMSDVEQQCRVSLSQLNDAAADYAIREARRFEFPAATGSDSCGSAGQQPSGVVPPPLSASFEDGGMQASRQRSKLNLGSLLLLDDDASSAAGTLRSMRAFIKASWERQQTATSGGGTKQDASAQLAMRSIETGLFAWSSSAYSLERIGSALTSDQATDLEAVVDYYRLLSNAMHTVAAEGSLGALQVELRSRATLVVWIAFCLTRAATCKAHPLAKEYGVGLRYADLRHLTLSDKAAVDALLGVAHFLRRHTAAGRDVFTLRDSAPTFDLARRFAASDAALLAAWRDEDYSLSSSAASRRVEAHWAEVQRKKCEAEKLKSKLQQHRQELSAAESRHSSWESDYRWRSGYRYDTNPHGSSVESARRAAASTESALKEMQKAPAALIQPLPQSKDKALQWLFFMHMPSLFRSLSRLTFLGQQMLLPLTEEAGEAVAVEACSIKIAEHYNGRQTGTYCSNSSPLHEGEDGHVMLHADGEIPSSNYGPRHIDNMHSKSDGVWYPDQLSPTMTWEGSCSSADVLPPLPSGESFFDPFSPRIKDVMVVTSYTEQLRCHPELQWAMEQRGSREVTPADRGNLPMAQQDSKPEWLDKPGFLAFGSLRSYPLRQLRHLCSALHDRLLPLIQPDVHVLVRQALHHVGALVPSAEAADADAKSPLRLLWRSDWDDNDDGSVLDTLCSELKSLADELEQTPREHMCVLLLGELAGHLSAWHGACRAVALQYAAMTSRWADELGEEMAAAALEAQDELRAKQRLLRMLAVLCYGSLPVGSLTAAEVGDMLRLMALINHACLWLDTRLSLHAQLAALSVRSHDATARHIAQSCAIARNEPLLLTEAVQAVLSYASDSIEWQHLTTAQQQAGSSSATSTSFEGIGADGHLYSLNLLNGTILIDGNPPSRLPLSITGHPLFVRTFGDCNFEVSRTDDGVLRSNKPIDGRYYNFVLADADGKQLVVTEVERLPPAGGGGGSASHAQVELQLLDTGTDSACRGWGEDLPVRLRELHSHWLSRYDDDSPLGHGHE